MNKLELILFNVGHGLSVVLIEHPENYVTVVDLGSEPNFSPIQYLATYRNLRAYVLYVTHPHGDHISDIEKAFLYRPYFIYCQDYNWEDVIKREKPELRHKIQKFRKFINSVSRGSYNGNASLLPFGFSPKQAIEVFEESRYINNSSLLLIYTWRDFKIAIAGDHETDAMEKLCKWDKFKTQAKGTDILVAPHHGHYQGYTSLWPTEIGKPYITLISVQSRDPSVASGYQSPDFARGFTIGGVKRYSLTTRTDGNISVFMWYGSDGKPKWEFRPKS